MQRPKGTKDIFGKRSDLNSFVKRTLENISSTFNFKRIETPIFEKKEVFERSVGKETEVVQKEMYTFTDKGDREMVLRPEGTSGVIRAIAENKLYAESLPLKYYYYGQMFRYENPQKGRQRQFNQFGVELLSEKSPYLDSEVILMASTILNTFKIKYDLKINYLGDSDTRKKWSEELKKYLAPFKNKLEKISLERLEKNPLRILDDKIEMKKDFIKKAPKISDFYTKEQNEYFNSVLNFLKQMGIDYIVDSNLVRGLDYYSDTAFEFIPKSDNSSQGTIIGGGRYGKLLKEFGGPELSGVGFGIGIERLINEIEKTLPNIEIGDKLDVYVMNLDEVATSTALGITYALRLVGLNVDWNHKPVKLNKAFVKAEKEGAKIKIIIGKDEIKSKKLGVKIGKEQEKVEIDKITDFIIEKVGGLNE